MADGVGQPRSVTQEAPTPDVRPAPDRRLGALARRFNLCRERAPIMRFCARGAGWPKTFTGAAVQVASILCGRVVLHAGSAGSAGYRRLVAPPRGAGSASSSGSSRSPYWRSSSLDYSVARESASVLVTPLAVLTPTLAPPRIANTSQVGIAVGVGSLSLILRPAFA